MSCSLLDIVGGVCSAEEATSVLLQFSGVETEIELIIARSGIFVKPDTWKSCSSPKPVEKENEN